MLQDMPAIFDRDHDNSIMMTTDMEVGETRPYVDPFDDVFGSAPASPVLNANDAANEAVQPANDSADMRRLRSTHVTNGYREGIAQSKDQHIQAGFDEGYSLGAELGLKAGWCLGVLDGVHRALATKNAAGMDDQVVVVKEKLQTAQEELKLEKLFAKNHFGIDGVWLYDVPGQEEEGSKAISFEEVAAAHPVIRSWTLETVEVARSSGVDVHR